MPMVRKQDYKKPINVLAAFLVEGSLDRYNTPGWDEGTACEELTVGKRAAAKPKAKN